MPKFNILILFFLLFFNLNLILSSNKYFSYIINIGVEDIRLNNDEPIIGYYKGNKFIFDNFMAIINESQKKQYINLIFTPQIRYKRNYIERVKDKDCKFFYLKSIYKDNKFAGWQINEESDDLIPDKFPKNSLIILLDPKFIDKISYVKSKINNEFIYQLPTIFIKKDLYYEFKKSLIINSINDIDSNIALKKNIISKHIENKIILINY